MASSAMRSAFVALLAASLLCLASSQDDEVEYDDVATMNRKLLYEVGCPCAHEGHHAGDCPCHLDTSWLDANECPTCPVYGCGDCDPLKCDECKRCCDGTVLSKDRKTCTCPSCDITGCLECDAEDCSKCLVCHQGYKLGADRKCKCAHCGVDYCETCDPENCYTCKVCNPFLVKTENGYGCTCPECPINGCQVCNPLKCDECLICVDGEIPGYTGECEVDKNCTIPHCVECTSKHECKVCGECYELANYNTECVAKECRAPNCLECDPYDCDKCIKCKDGYEYHPEYDVCEVTGCEDTIPYCAKCNDYDPTICDECWPGYTWCDTDKKCKCEHCDAPGCKTCDDYICGQCTECKEGYDLQDDGTCVVTPVDCTVPYCKVCNVYDPNTCDVCIDGYATTPDGKCECDGCAVPNCEKCSLADCSVCEKCLYGYGPSGTNDCPCELCDVPNCAACDTEDCKKCGTCNPGYILQDTGYGEPTCVCDPDQCTLDNCKTCSADDCGVCGECKEGLVLDAYGNCVCGDECSIPGCEQCCKKDCTTCTKCAGYLTLSDDKKSCDCPDCTIDGCSVCDPNDCSRCLVCDGLEDPDDYGQCGCPEPCNVPYCAQCSNSACGSCEVCEPGYTVNGYDGTCECTEAGLVGCLAPAGKENNCMCSDCQKPLVRSDCGYCVVDGCEPGCQWSLVAAYGNAPCDLVCADDKVYTSVAVQSLQGTFPCYADVGDQGIRSGTNTVNKPGVCTVEYESGEPHADMKIKTLDVSSFWCVCHQQAEPTSWVQKNVGHDMHDRGCTDTCRTVISYVTTEKMRPVAMPGWGDRKPPSLTATLPVSVCQLDGEVGYNVDEGPYKGYCMTPTTASQEGYQCLCSDNGKCEQPRCPNIPLTTEEAFRPILVT